MALAFLDGDSHRGAMHLASRVEGCHETVGVVRAVSDANNTAAEFGILVRSDFQGKGLGLALMRKIIAYCRARGTGRIYGHILPTNRGMLALATRLGFELDHVTDDNVVIANLKLRD